MRIYCGMEHGDNGNNGGNMWQRGETGLHDIGRAIPIIKIPDNASQKRDRFKHFFGAAITIGAVRLQFDIRAGFIKMD